MKTTPHLGHCFTCKFKSSNKTVNATSFENYHILLDFDKILSYKYRECYAFLHLANEIPVLDRDFDFIVKWYSHIQVNSITTISGVEADIHPSYDQCYNNCFNNKITSCQNTLETRISEINHTVRLELMKTCRINCVKSRFSVWSSEEFYTTMKTISKSCVSIKILLQQSKFSSVEFEVTSNFIINIEEHKSYTFIQLINDIGGVIGFILGASLLSVGNMAINLFFK